MVSQKTIEIVKATAPILKERGEEITQRMYQIAFEQRPDYKRGFETTWMQHLDGGGQARNWPQQCMPMPLTSIAWMS